MVCFCYSISLKGP